MGQGYAEMDQGYAEMGQRDSYLCCKLLQPSDVNGAFLRCVEVATTHTKVRGRTDHPAGETEGVVRKDCFRSTIVVLEGGGEGRRGMEEGQEGVKEHLSLLRSLLHDSMHSQM